MADAGDDDDGESGGSGRESPISPYNEGQLRLKHTLRRTGRRVFRSNHVATETYSLKIDDTSPFLLDDSGNPVDQILMVMDALKALFDNVLEHIVQGLPGDASVSITLDSEEFTSEFAIPITRVDRLTGELVAGTIKEFVSSAFEGLRTSDLTTITANVFIPVRGNGGSSIFTVGVGRGDSRKLKRSIRSIQNRDSFCLARAIYIGRRGNEPLGASVVRKLLKRPNHKMLEKAAHQLVAACGFDMERAGALASVKTYESVLRTRICVFSTIVSNNVLYPGNPAFAQNGTVFLYHVQETPSYGHFDVISNVKGFLRTKFFCDVCMKGYNLAFSHNCSNTCASCNSSDCARKEYSPRSCIKCKITFASAECFGRHKKTGKRVHRGVARTWCEKRRKCTECNQVVCTTSGPQHVCGYKLCSFCRTMQPTEHVCFHRAYKPRKDKEKFLFIDFECDVRSNVEECVSGYSPLNSKNCSACARVGSECAQCRLCVNCSKRSCGRTKHVPNYCVVQRCCPECIGRTSTEGGCDSCPVRCSNCSVNNKNGAYRFPPCSAECRAREVVFSGRQTVDDVGRYVFRKENRGYTVVARVRVRILL